MIELDNRVNFKVDLEFITKIADYLSDKEIELLITDNKEIQGINNEYRQINKPTDVLSFPYDDMPLAPLGSIVISSEFVQEKALELGHSESDEFSLLFIHGMLHLLGMDHEVDSGQMRTEEERIIKHFSLPDSLITRVEG